MTESKQKLYSILALVCAIWFLLTGWLWAYFANLFISLPVGILGFFFWNKVWQENKANKTNRVAFVILVSGLVISLIALILLLFSN